MPDADVIDAEIVEETEESRAVAVVPAGSMSQRTAWPPNVPGTSDQPTRAPVWPKRFGTLDVPPGTKPRSSTRNRGAACALVARTRARAAAANGERRMGTLRAKASDGRAGGAGPAWTGGSHGEVGGGAGLIHAARGVGRRVARGGPGRCSSGRGRAGSCIGQLLGALLGHRAIACGQLALFADFLQQLFACGQFLLL